MTESQYTRANKKVYPVVLVQFAIMIFRTVFKLVTAFSIKYVILLILPIIGAVITTQIMKKPETKKCSEQLMGLATGVYFIFLLLDFFTYHLCICGSAYDCKYYLSECTFPVFWRCNYHSWQSDSCNYHCCGGQIKSIGYGI